MVPKFLVDEDGTMGARNGVITGGIEHKMGIKGQATCVLNFDDAIAWRLGPKPAPAKPGEKRSASAGMAGMFGMMNAARLGVGVQGIAIGEVAYQNGYAYAHERRVGHALTGAKEPDKSADLEIVHPDVKRMLLHARAFVEGARAVALWTTLNMSIASSARPERETAGLLADLMTPVIKAFCTDMGFEARTWRCSAMAVTATSATMAWNSSCATAASTRPMKAPTACRRWIWWAASSAARAARRPWRCSTPLAGSQPKMRQSGTRAVRQAAAART